jgi:hypothetical protein
MSFLNSYSYKELRALAKQYEIPQYYRMTKARLIEMLKTEVVIESVDTTDSKEEISIDSISTVFKYITNMSIQRDTHFRQQKKLKCYALKEPFSFINEGYVIQCETIPGEDIDTVDFEVFFPKHIEHYFWIQEGQHDAEPWRCLAKIGYDTGYYAFYEAGCDYTGFDCEGFMKLWISKNYDSLINFAMNEQAYQQYIADTNTIDTNKCGWADTHECKAIYCKCEDTLGNCVTDCANCVEYGYPCLNCIRSCVDCSYEKGSESHCPNCD